MRSLRGLLFVSLAALLFAACGSVPKPDGLVGGAIAGAISSSAPSGGTGAAVATSAVADFQAGETLASQDDRGMGDANYYVAKVLQAAGPETKNQAQVIFVSDGKKYWVNYVLGSRKAVKSDFAIGTTVLVLRGWQNHDEIPADSYRKDSWELGNVTSVEELYKNRVEVNGESYSTNYIRIPTDPIR